MPSMTKDLFQGGAKNPEISVRQKLHHKNGIQDAEQNERKGA